MTRNDILLAAFAALLFTANGIGIGYLLWHHDCSNQIITHDPKKDAKVDSTLNAISERGKATIDSLRQLSPSSQNAYLHTRLGASRGKGRVSEPELPAAHGDTISSKPTELLAVKHDTVCLDATERMNLLTELSGYDECQKENQVLKQVRKDLVSENDSLSVQAVNLQEKNTNLEKQFKDQRKQKRVAWIILAVENAVGIFYAGKAITK